VLYERLKIPPAINQFLKPLDRAEAAPIFKLLEKYRPESKAEKKVRLDKEAVARAAPGADAKAKVGPAPVSLKFGLNHVTHLVEEKKAKLVVIASDVDPIELVVWLPALCRKMGVPYVIVNNKGVLGKFVHQKKAAAVALVHTRAEDGAALERILDTANAKFAGNVAATKKWGGGIMGLKTQMRLEKREKLLKLEMEKRAKL
jgi:large subunit ribosomal protein L7Ae